MRRKKKREYRTRMVKQVLESNKGPKIIKRKLEGGRELLSSLKTTDGTEVTDKVKITATIEQFYSELYSSDRSDWRTTEDWDLKAENVPSIMEDEVQKAVEQMS